MGLRRRLGRLVSGVLGAGVASVVFASTFAVSLVVHGDLPSAKRAAGALSTALLGGLFEGKLLVRSVEHIGWDGVDVAEAEVVDPWGRRVVTAKGLHVRVPLASLALSLRPGSPSKVVALPNVWLDEADVVLDRGPDGRVRVAAAFSPKPKPPPPGPPTPPTPPSPFRVELPHIEIGHVHGMGEPAAGLDIDADGYRVPGSVLVTQDGVSVDVESFGLRARAPQVIHPSGTGEYHLRVARDAPPRMWSTFQGTVGEMYAGVSARLDGATLDATVDVPRASPGEIASLLPQARLTENVSARVVVSGTLPELKASARAVSGPSEVVIEAKAAVAMPLRLKADVKVRDLDPRLLSAAAPPASLGADAKVSLLLDLPNVQAEVEATTFPFTLSGQAVPGATVKASYQKGAIAGQAEIYEPGIPTKGEFTVDPLTGNVTFDLEAKAERLSSAPRLKGAVEGYAKARAKGRYHKETGLDAVIDADLRGVGRGQERLGSGKLHARLFGQPKSLGFDARLSGSKVELGGTTIEGGRVEASGPLTSPRVKVTLTDPRWSALSLSAVVRPGRGAKQVDLGNVKGELDMGDVKTKLEVGEVAIGGGGVSLKHVVVDSGAGAIKGDVGIDAGGLQASLEGKVDLASLGRLIPQVPLTGGAVDFAVNLRSDGARRKGEATIAVRNARVLALPVRFAADGRAGFDGEQVTTRVAASATLEGDTHPLVTAVASADARVAGPLLAKRPWEQATGRASLDDLVFDLDQLFTYPPLKTLTAMKPDVPQLSGRVRLSGEAERGSAEALPRVELRASTDALSVVVPGANGAKGGTPSFQLKGVDVAASVAATPVASDAGAHPGHAHERFDVDTLVRVTSGDDVLSTLAAKTTVEALETIADAEAIARDPHGAAARAALDRIGAAPLRVRLGFRDRPIQSLPAPFRPTSINGNISGSVDVSGTIAHPVANFAVQASQLAAEIEGSVPWPIYGSIAGTFDDERLAIAGTLVHHGGPESLELSTTARVGLGDLIWQRPKAKEWELDAEARFNAFAIHAVPQLAAANIGGALTGSVRATGLHKTPRIEANLALSQGHIRDAQLTRLELHGWLADAAGVLTLETDQPPAPGSTQGGSLRVTALPSVKFKDGYNPSLDPVLAHTVSARLEHFAIDAFSPLTAPVLAGLRGFVDGEATLTIGKRSSTDRPVPTQLWGGLRWSEGVVLIPQLGQTLTRGSVTVTTGAQDNTTLVFIRGLTLHGTTGQLHGKGEIALPNDLIVYSLLGDKERAEAERARFFARADLSIDKDEKIPVTFEGVALGDAYGEAEGALRLVPTGVDVQIGVPELTFELPESNSQNRPIQDLADSPEVGVVDRLFRDEVRKKKTSRGLWKISVGLGQQLSDMAVGGASLTGTVLVRRAGLDARVRGRTDIELGGEQVRIEGTVETVSGRVLALGKPFEVQRGFIRFEGPPTNPYITLGAAWDSPEGARVYAELIGYLKEAKLRLRTEPPRPESEVLALVLFGRDPTAAPVPGQTQLGADQSLAAGSGVASTVLTSLLDPVQIFGRPIETRVDTTTARGTSIGVAAEIRPKLWATVDVSTARQQDRQNADLSAVTLDWRFRPAWSLRTTVGDRGSSTVELLWQYRY